MESGNIGLWSRFSLTTKILVVFMTLSVVALAAVGVLALMNLRGMGTYALDSQINLGTHIIADSSSALKKLGEDAIRQKADDVGKQLGIYIKSNADKTVAQLRNDSTFRSIAIQPVGQTGYTVVLGLNDGIYYFHKSDVFENKSARELFTVKEGAYYNPKVFDLINQTLSTRKDSGGYYDWIEPDGQIRPKYVWFSIVDVPTTDAKQIFVAATTYIDEFSRPVIDTNAKINAAISTSTEYIKEKESNMVYTFAGLFLVILLLAGWMAYRFSKAISRPVLSLTAAALSMEEGKITEQEIAQLSRKQGKDEVASLSRVFAKMAAEVKARETKLKKQVEELRIEIDHSKKARQVAEITETDYFQNLKQRAKEMREKKEGE